MTEKQVYQEADKLSDYIIQMFEHTEASVSERLFIMSLTVNQVIRDACIGADDELGPVVTILCNSLLRRLKESDYPIGSKDRYELLAKIVSEAKVGGNVEEIVDKYVDCKTPELRQYVIDGIRQMVGNHMLDNMNIGD